MDGTAARSGAPAARRGAISREQLIADTRELAGILEDTHPDPYANGGGRIAFHRRLHRVLNAIPAEGLDRDEYLRLIRPFIAGVGDAHTGLVDGYEVVRAAPGGVPLELGVVEESLVVVGIAQAGAGDLLGARLIAVEELGLGELVERQRNLQGIDNLYHALRVLADRSLKYRPYLLDLIPEWTDPRRVRVEHCNVHGNEPSGREGCLMMIRELALSDDPWVIELLSQTTVLIVPSFNADGRANNTRGNSAGQDLNRDHARLTQPESQIFARFLRDYTPEVMVDGHEFGNANTCDLPFLWPRHSNTAPSVHAIAKTGLVEGHLYDAGAADGWWGCPYPPRGIDGAQTFTRVTGLKNMVTTLVEARSGGGPSRPAEVGNVPENRRRKAYSQRWAIHQALLFHRVRRGHRGCPTGRI